MQARLLILGAALLFSTGGLAIKATSLDAWQVAGLRSGIACVILALAYVLLTRGAARVPAFELSLLLLLEAVLNPLWTFLLLGEGMGGLALVGAAIILALIVVDAAGRRTSN